MAMQLGKAERNLILSCVTKDPSLDAGIRELASERLEWNDIFMSSLWHKVAFIVYARLQDTRALDIALTEGNLHLLLLNHWKQLQKVNKLRSELYGAVAVEICSTAEEVGVDLAISKGGIAMFGREYSHAERKTYDVDFIGRREELRGIEEVFRRTGFGYGEYSHSQEMIGPARPGDLRKHLLQGRGLPNFLRKVESGPVDYLIAQVRFRVGSGSTQGNWLPAERLLEQAETRSGIRVVSRSDLALQLALHLHREAHEVEYQSWNLDWNLIKVCDFHRIIDEAPTTSQLRILVERAVALGFDAEMMFAALVTSALFSSQKLAELVALLREQGSKSAELDAVQSAFDESAVRRAIWSVGLQNFGQRGNWVEIAGAKTT